MEWKESLPQLKKIGFRITNHFSSKTHVHKAICNALVEITRIRKNISFNNKRVFCVLFKQRFWPPNSAAEATCLKESSYKWRWKSMDCKRSNPRNDERSFASRLKRSNELSWEGPHWSLQETDTKWPKGVGSEAEIGRNSFKGWAAMAGSKGSRF